MLERVEQLIQISRNFKKLGLFLEQNIKGISTIVKKAKKKVNTKLAYSNNIGYIEMRMGISDLKL